MSTTYGVLGEPCLERKSLDSRGAKDRNLQEDTARISRRDNGYGALDELLVNGPALSTVKKRSEYGRQDAEGGDEAETWPTSLSRSFKI